MKPPRRSFTEEMGLAPSQMPSELLFEIRRIGNVARVSVIDPRSNIEVTLVGDPKRGEAALKRAAVRKLIYVLQRRRNAAEGGTT